MGLFSVTRPVLPLFKGFVDYHCHILPGVDDGVRKMGDSLTILEDYFNMGVRRVFLTPHVMEDVPNSPADLKVRFEELQKAVAERGINVPELHLASEHMLDGLFERRLDSGDVLPYDSTHLLVETSYYNPPYNMDDLLFSVRAKGYVPVLAHPERYMYMDIKDYGKLKDEGVWFQLNLSSLLGFYGHDAKGKAERILKEGWYNLAGTDLHRLSTLGGYKGAVIKKSFIPRLEELLERNSEGL